MLIATTQLAKYLHVLYAKPSNTVYVFKNELYQYCDLGKQGKLFFKQEPQSTFVKLKLTLKVFYSSGPKQINNGQNNPQESDFHFYAK